MSGSDATPYNWSQSSDRSGRSWRSAPFRTGCRSKGIVLRIASRVDHEFQEIAVRIADVHAGTGFPAATLTIHRTFDDLRAHALQHRLQRRRCSIPDKTQVAARRFRGRRSKRERRILPVSRTMKVDHLIADGHEEGV